MWKITASQMREMGKALQQRFELGAVDYLRTNFADWSELKPDAELFNLIRLAINRARTYGITIEADVLRYLDYMVIYSQEFDTEPATSWAGEILRAQELSGTEKMDRIDAYDEFVMNRKD
ncbi:MAG TPA: hypothetical protein VFZ09_16475 [Archangium sp.]|uniref:hypothetical protein n=1 Tax=Archangium sp. TaxID=1872627 RepID=UPI002E32ECE2|nr:hypothetical protein [Archangium sp.]HEX5747841.1 hypothetical protein [Archangium sp.]